MEYLNFYHHEIYIKSTLCISNLKFLSSCVLVVGSIFNNANFKDSVLDVVKFESNKLININYCSF